MVSSCCSNFANGQSKFFLYAFFSTLQWAYKYEYSRTQKSNNTIKPLPEALNSYNATGAPKIMEIGFTMLENKQFESSRKWFDVGLNF